MGLINRIPSKKEPLGIKRIGSDRYLDRLKLKRNKVKSYDFLIRKFYEFDNKYRSLVVIFANNGGVWPTYEALLFVRHCNFDNKGEFFFVLNNSGDGISFANKNSSSGGCKVLDPYHKIKTPFKYLLTGCSGCTNEFNHTRNKVEFLYDTRGIRMGSTVPAHAPLWLYSKHVEERKEYDCGTLDVTFGRTPLLDSTLSDGNPLR